MFEFILNLFQTKEERVESAKQKFHDSLIDVENNPLDQKFLSIARDLGHKYEEIARKLEININSSRNGFDRIKDISVAQFRGLEKLKLSKIESETDEIMLVISGNWGDIPMTLTEWIKKGPGIRFLRHPFRVWNLRTGEEMSLDDISIQYRNNEESRRMIEIGELENPWDFETEH